MKETKRYWCVTRRWYDVRTAKLVVYGYDIYTEINGRQKRIMKNALDIPRSKIRKLVKVLNGDL